MSFDLSDVFSNIQKVASTIPIGTKSRRFRFGEHSSKFKGQGPNFYQIVEYNPEEHTIDQIQWHLTDDEGKVYVREAIISKDFPVIVMADISPSMMSGTDYQYKKRLLLDTVGNIGLTCFHGQDPMGFIGFSDRIVFNRTPRVGEANTYFIIEQVYNYFRDMEKGQIWSQGARTDFFSAFEPIKSYYANKQCLLIVISDFIGAEELVGSQLLKDIAVKHEIVFLFLDDPTEFSIKSRLKGWLWHLFGRLSMTNIETGKEVVVRFNKLQKNEQEIRTERKRLRNSLIDMGINSMVLEYSPENKHFQRLLRFFMLREESFKAHH